MVNGTPRLPRQPSGDRAGAAHRHLLSEDRPDRELGSVDASRDAPTRRARDERGELRVGAEDVVDRVGVGVEIEQSAAALDRRGEVAQIRQPQPAVDESVGGRQLDDPVAVAQIDRPPVRAIDDLLDTRNRAHPEEPQQGRAVERAPDREPQGDGPRSALRPAGVVRRGAASVLPRTPRGRCR